MYEFHLERFANTCIEFAHLYKAHHAEMMERFAREGLPVTRMKMDVAGYLRAEESGKFLNYTARLDGEPVGHCNVFLFDNMHDGELTAREDVLYMLPGHRNGTGLKLMKCVLNDLRGRGVKHFRAGAVTDPRAAALWKRLGFKPVCTLMNYSF